MTKYEINHSYVIEADDIMAIGSRVYNTDKDMCLPANTIVKITYTSSTIIEMQVLKCQQVLLIGSIWLFNNESPAEDVHFVHLLKNLDPLATPELQENGVEIDKWPRKYLLEYIAFLEINQE